MEKMTSVIPIDRKVTVKGQRSGKISPSDESTRAFFNFSHENLSVSQSDIEEGLNEKISSRCSKINRQMLLSSLAICLSIVCLAFETIKIKKIVDNSRDVEMIKADLATLKQRIYAENLLEEIKAFEQQLFADGNDSNDTDLDDYDYNYDYEISQNNYLSDYELTSPMRSNQTTITGQSESIAEKDEKISSNLHETDGTDEGPILSRHIKTKRFIAEEPSISHSINEEVLTFPSESLQISTSKNDTNRNFANSSSGRTVFPKKYGGRRHRPHRKKTSAMNLKSLNNQGGMSRRHIRPSRQIFAAHYGADSTLFHGDDEHTGNGRARHNEGIFKAWRGSDWMDDLGMNRYFSLARDGRLTVHETGLYIVYAQIHYLDEHDENGFHLLVNGRPILQCMVYSPGNGHKSRSCFSAQVTYLLSGDRIILKDVGPARYTLFQADKSFFGLAKLGDSRQFQQTQMRHNSSLQEQTTPFQ